MPTLEEQKMTDKVVKTKNIWTSIQVGTHLIFLYVFC